MTLLSNKRILILVENLYEDLELWYPKLRLLEEGATVQVAGPEKKEYRGKNGYPCMPDITIHDVEMRHFDAVIIPGGFAPDKLRRIPRVLDIVRIFHERNKVIAFICHAGWVPISAKILRGKKVTGVSAIKDDLENAGATYLDHAVVVDGNLITSRTPADLPDFCRAIIRALSSS
jgi:protease I